MPVRNVEDLTPAARAAVETYVASVVAATRAVDPDLVDDTVADVTAHLLHSLSPDSTPAQVAAIAEELGAPEDYADALQAGFGPEPAHTDGGRGSGTFLGIPFDWRPPTHERAANRLWNPRDRRIFVPRIFGVGWAVNFGAIAVLLRLIEPDAEDEPFSEVADGAFLLALLVPVGLTAMLLGSFLALAASLPAELPSHWNAAGAPDDFWPARVAFGVLFAIALLPTLWAAWSVAASRPRFQRGGSIAAASFLAAVAVGVWTLTLLTVFEVAAGWWLPIVCIFAAFPVPLVVLVVLSRAGRSAELRRDLGSLQRGEGNERF